MPCSPPRIGSDEDTEGSDESLSLEDPSDTAVSRSTMMEHRQDSSQPTTGASGSAAALQQAGSTTSPQQQKEATTEKEEEKEADTSEADGTLESRGEERWFD